MLKRIIASPFFIFPIVAGLVFWPFTLQLFTLKNDALTYYYPIRTLISDAIRNAELPLWTPFINMGYPLHADMQSGAWNPVIWIFAFLSNYSLAAFHYEFLFYIAFAGVGFYFLCRNMGCSRPVAFCMGFAFQFCGFIVDSVQFFNCISSACYLPFVFLFFRRMLLNFRKRDAASFAIFMFLLFTGGYPSIFIILSYVLLTFGIFSVIVAEQRGGFIKTRTPVLIIAALIFALLSLPAIISFVQHLPTIERGGRQPLSIVLENSMNPSTSLSMLVPFATTAGDTWLDSSILMRSIYIGIVPLVFLVFIFFRKKLLREREIQFFLVAAAVLLGLAWGEYFFLRTLAYHVLPLMDSFRHPALFRLFAIFFLLLIAARGMQYWITHQQLSNVVLKKIIYCILGFLIFISTWSLIKIEGNAFANLLAWPGPATLAQLPFANRMLLQVPFTLLILVAGFVAITKKRSTNLLMIIVLADMFCATQFNMPVTVMGAKSFAKVEETLNRNPVKFPLPGNTSIEENSENSLDEVYLSGSKIPFSKKIGRNGYYVTPGNLLTQERFYNSSIQASVFKNSVFYFADAVVQLNNIRNDSVGNLAFSENDQLSPEIFSTVQKQITVSNLSANSIEASISNPGNGLLVLLQNNYKGWKAFIDEKPVAILPVNITYMAIRTAPGKHVVRFEYEPKFIRTAFYISMLIFCLLILSYLLPLFSKFQKGKRPQEN